MRSLTLALLLAACTSPDPLEAARIDPPEPLTTEVAVSVRGPATVTNIHPELDLIIADIRFEPDDESVLRWFSEGPFTLTPGQAMTFDVWYRPAEEGSLPATVFVNTDAGELSAPLTLEGLPPTDGDGDGLSEALGDCDDSDAEVYPDAAEVCDGLDNDCDEDVDGPFDADGDGFLSPEDCPDTLGPLDCNDRDGSAFPGNVEECDGSDSDCNGVVDDIDTLADLQAGVCEGALKRCTAGGPEEPFYTEIEGYERVEFSCDGIDNDCDGTVDGFDRLGDGTDDCVDDDGDGEAEVNGDCDDADPERTSANCGASTLIVTRNDDGFAKVDLNSGKVELVDVGVRTYHGVAADPDVLWLAARYEGRLVRYDLNTEAALFSTRFERPPMAVEMDDTSGELLVLFADGAVQTRDVLDGNLIREVDIGGTPTAWTKAPDGTLWVCNAGDGRVTHASPTRGALASADITTNCYGPPALDGTRLVVPGFDDRVLIEVDTRTLKEVRARATVNQPIRARWIGRDLWVTTSVTRQLEIFDGPTLLREEQYAFDGQTQGIWWDTQRDMVWIAVFGNDEIVGLDRRSRTVKTRLPIPQPIYLFPMPPG